MIKLYEEFFNESIEYSRQEYFDVKTDDDLKKLYPKAKLHKEVSKSYVIWKLSNTLYADIIKYDYPEIGIRTIFTKGSGNKRNYVYDSENDLSEN